MPIVALPAQMQISDIDIALWHLAEEEDELVEMCSAQGIDVRVADSLRLAKRRKEVLAEHLLLNHLLGQFVKVEHKPNGAPRIDCGKNISISHTAGYVAVALSNHNIGIDIEQKGTKVLRVRDRFLSQTEKIAIGDNNLDANLIAWTAKEALYKAIGEEGIEFADAINIDGEAIARGDAKYTSAYNERRFATYSSITSDYAMTIAIEL